MTLMGQSRRPNGCTSASLVETTLVDNLAWAGPEDGTNYGFRLADARWPDAK